MYIYMQNTRAGEIWRNSNINSSYQYFISREHFKPKIISFNLLRLYISPGNLPLKYLIVWK